MNLDKHDIPENILKFIPDFEEQERELIAKATEIGRELDSDDIFETLCDEIGNWEDQVVLNHVCHRRSDVAYLTALLKVLVFEPYINFNHARIKEHPDNKVSITYQPLSKKRIKVLNALRSYLLVAAAYAKRCQSPSLADWREMYRTLSIEHLYNNDHAYDVQKMETLVNKLTDANVELFIDCSIIRAEKRAWGDSTAETEEVQQ